MDKVSLTYFVDFVMKSGTPKLSIVRDFKDRDKYEPFMDFYKNAREAMVEAHKDAAPKKALDRFLASVKDEKKRKVYPGIIKGHKKFLGRKTVTWFQPPTAVCKIGSLDVGVNPELGLIIDDVPHVIKLYFKEGRLVANRVSSIVHLMTVALAQSAPGTVFGLLDVRHSKLHVLRNANPSLHALLEGEAAAFGAMYSVLEEQTRATAIESEQTDAMMAEATAENTVEAPSNVVSISVPFRPLERANVGA
jgi:hypothetical protein